jgi:hypothetical protein
MVERLPFFRNKNLSQSPVFFLPAKSPWEESDTEQNLLASFFSDNRTADPFFSNAEPDDDSAAVRSAGTELWAIRSAAPPNSRVV